MLGGSERARGGRMLDDEGLPPTRDRDAAVGAAEPAPDEVERLGRHGIAAPAARAHDVRRTWPEAPVPPTAPHRRVPQLLLELVALAMCAVAPVFRSVELPHGSPWLVAAVGAGASVALAVVGDRLAPLRLVVPIAAGLAVLTPVGRLGAVWFAATVLTCDWALRRRSPLGGARRPSHDVAVPVVVLLAVAWWRAADPSQRVAPSVFVALAVVALALDAANVPLDRVGAAVGRLVSRVTSQVLFALLGVLGVLVPWLAQRVGRIDPLRPARGAGDTWVRRGRREIRPGRAYAGDASIGERSTSQKVWAGISTLPLVALVVVGVIASTSSNSPPSSKVIAVGPGVQRTEVTGDADPDDVPIPAAFAGQEWYRTYLRDVNWMLLPKAGVWQPLNAQRIADVRSTYVNVTKGVRVTWHAPPCGCKRRTVWLYGGSTTFGMGQRDDHTIASELARVASRNGITLDVVNKGVLGDLQWREADRFAWDLTREPKPDLVLFYDGANEIWSAQKIQQLGGGDPAGPVDPLVEEIWNGMKSSGQDPGDTPPGVAKLATPGGSLTDAQVGELAVRRFDRSRQISADAAKAHGIAIEWFWQPSRFSRPRVEGESGRTAAEDVGIRVPYDTAASMVPAAVHDLSKVFVGNHDPLFYDDVHHNEEGARIVAAAIFQQIQPQLRSLR